MNCVKKTDLMKKPLLISILSLLSIFSFAQKASFKGNIYDYETGEAISDAVLILDDSLHIKTTDLQGYFNFTNIEPGKHSLKISFIGYENYNTDIILKPGQSYYQKFSIIPSTVTLQGIELSAQKQQRKTETQISVLQVTPKQMKVLPSIGGQADIVQFLQVIPGIITTGDQGGQVFIRGGAPVQNRIMLDGLTIINPFHFIGSYSVFETEALKNVEVHTGGFNAEYGGRISSIVSIKTKEGNKKELKGICSASPFMAKALVEGPIIKMKDQNSFNASFLLTAKRSLIEKTAKSIYPWIIKRDSTGLPFLFQDIYGKLSLDLGSGNNINIFGFNFTDRYKNPRVSDISWTNSGGGINFRIIPASSNLIIDAIFGLSDYRTNFIDSDLRARYSKLSDFDANFNFSYHGDSYKVDYGLDLNATHTDFTFQNYFNQTFVELQYTTNFAVYTKYVQKWKKLIIEPGIRLNYYASLADFIVEPRFSFKYNLTQRFRVKGSAGIYTQNILSTANDKDVINYFIGFISSPEESLYSYVKKTEINDKLQKARHLIGGFEFDTKNNLEFNLEGYFKKFDQLVEINRNKNSAAETNYVVETGNAYGVDFSAKYQLSSVYFWFTYSLGYVFRNDGTQIYNPIYDRRHNINLLVNYSFGKAKSWQASMRWNLGSGFPFTKTQGFYDQITFPDGVDTHYTTDNPDNFGIVYSYTRNGGRLPYYHRLDLSLQKHIEFRNKKAANVNLSVINVYNRENIFYLDRINKRRINQFPILPSMGIDFEF